MPIISASTGGDKAALSQAKPTCVSSTAQVKPFAGKVFYLDLPSNRIAETLENDIKNLGGTVEKFFSKEIKYLVSNKREARYAQCLRQDSPVPSPDSGPSSPHPRTNHVIEFLFLFLLLQFVQSRGKSLVERVVKEQERVKINKILSNALEWGVKILYIDDIMAYVQKKKKLVSSLCPATTAVKTSVSVQVQILKYIRGRISKPFVKVEDSSRHYRPVYLTMPNMPEFNLKTIPPCSPFCVEDKDPPGNKQPGHRYGVSSPKTRDKKRGGYCECCMTKYENVTTHLKSERHKAFSKSDKYLVVDKLVSALQHCNFLHIKTQVKSSTSHFHNMNVQNEASSKCLDVKTNQQEESDKKQDSLVSEAVEDGNMLPDKMTANNLSERKEASLPSLSFSPVRKIQRRVRVYKRKRRKVNTPVEQVKPSDIPNDSRLKLWELFQSSDDMDVEFLGFKD
uniref:Protein DBF4 homolog A n=1 Tax=Sander lucioperca TaxID=283035 RepID=A0A8C9XAN1_SANLU